MDNWGQQHDRHEHRAKAAFLEICRVISLIQTSVHRTPQALGTRSVVDRPTEKEKCGRSQRLSLDCESCCLVPAAMLGGVLGERPSASWPWSPPLPLSPPFPYPHRLLPHHLLATVAALHWAAALRWWQRLAPPRRGRGTNQQGLVWVRLLDEPQ